MYIEVKADIGIAQGKSFDYLFCYDLDANKFYVEDVLILNQLRDSLINTNKIKRARIGKKINEIEKRQEQFLVEKNKMFSLVERLKTIDFSKIITERIDNLFWDGWRLTFKISSDRSKLHESNALFLKLECPDSSKQESETRKLYELCKEFCSLAGDNTLYEMEL